MLFFFLHSHPLLHFSACGGLTSKHRHSGIGPESQPSLYQMGIIIIFFLHSQENYEDQ